MKKPKGICEFCGEVFSHYDDGRGGDIGKRICRVCSFDKDQDIDRNKPANMKRYVEEICPFYL